MLLRELHKQAQAEGGAVYMLNGNHESLNVSGNFRYRTSLLYALPTDAGTDINPTHGYASNSNLLLTAYLAARACVAISCYESLCR